MGCHALLQGIFPTQGSNPRLLHCKQILYFLSHQGSPRYHCYPHFTGKETEAQKAWGMCLKHQPLKHINRDFLTVQWLRLHGSTVGSMGLTPGQETRILYALPHRKKKKKKSAITLLCLSCYAKWSEITFTGTKWTSMIIWFHFPYDVAMP